MDAVCLTLNSVFYHTILYQEDNAPLQSEFRSDTETWSVPTDPLLPTDSPKQVVLDKEREWNFIN